MDVRLKCGVTGIELLGQMIHQRPGTCVIVITAHTLQVRKLRSFNHITGIIAAVAAAAAISRCRQVQMLSQVRRC
jgi:DNA-binding LytR/AlgR family response regulator